MPEMIKGTVAATFESIRRAAYPIIGSVAASHFDTQCRRCRHVFFFAPPDEELRLPVYDFTFMADLPSKRKPVADEMFPDGPGSWMDIDEVSRETSWSVSSGFLQQGSETTLDVTSNERAVHVDFFNSKYRVGLVLVRTQFAQNSTIYSTTTI